jgi:hypothetical protein
LYTRSFRAGFAAVAAHCGSSGAIVASAANLPVITRNACPTTRSLSSATLYLVEEVWFRCAIAHPCAAARVLSTTPIPCASITRLIGSAVDLAPSNYLGPVP